ncbi:MAG: tRNA (adenosine(37)-N6)-threonylcarbamoyltransferase complex transferase subunit TsaD [Verrucomicrobiota bacterium]
MTLLAFETSCDETSVAVIRDGMVLTNLVSTQIALHSEYGGVVPELATREHLRNLLPMARAALKETNYSASQIDAVAATRGPGLPSALMIGLKAGQAFAFALGKPFIGINHHEAHLFSPWISGTPPRASFEEFEPNVSLIVSGGHTMLVHVQGQLKHALLGETVDDAAGECFDKVAKLIGLPYPGGPEIDRFAESGNPKAHDFPRPMIHEPNHDFSFSGLKTSVRYFLDKNPQLLNERTHLCDLCASVQAAIIDVLVTKTIKAAKKLSVRCVTASGGVTCNRALRSRLAEACAASGLKLRLAEKNLCTDNAAMIGILAERKLLAGASPTSADAEVQTRWSLSSGDGA